MRLSYSAASFSFAAILFLSSSFSHSFSQYPVQSKDVRAEGVIVAFQKDNRYRVMPYTMGIATFVEFWIVRIDKWPYPAEKLTDKKYVLVEYNLYERAVTDCEINAKQLRFTLRQRRDNEHTDCLAFDRDTKSQRSQLSEYELTTPGKGEQIPPLLELPCLMADHGPVVIE
jgi:hypothetical protein